MDCWYLLNFLMPISSKIPKSSQSTALSISKFAIEANQLHYLFLNLPWRCHPVLQTILTLLFGIFIPLHMYIL